MTNIARTRNSTKRIAFNWLSTTAGVQTPLNLTGCTLQMLIDTEKVESTPLVPVRVATVDGVITDATGGAAYFPVTTGLTGTIQSLFYEVWLTDAVGETYPIDSGSLVIKGGLK